MTLCFSANLRRIVGVLVIVAMSGCTYIARSSYGSGYVQSDGISANPALSADGRHLAFESRATQLVSGDTNNQTDVFVRDHATNTTRRVSLSTGGTQPNATSGSPSVSSDGRFVAFYSLASNLVPGDTNQVPDIFVRDTATNTTTRASVGTGGVQGNGIAIAKTSISSDGRFVVFASVATNLVTGDTNGQSDVFVRDRVAATTVRVSTSETGAQAIGASTSPSMTGDGNYVAFTSTASNITSGDTNSAIDVFVRDRTAATVQRVSISTAATQADGDSTDPRISADGGSVSFSSTATNLVPNDTNAVSDVLVRDLAAAATELVSTNDAGVQGNGASKASSISADGRYVAFQSIADNIEAPDTTADDVFVRDRLIGNTTRASEGLSGTPANSVSTNPSISADGKYVAFPSAATNLANGDTNAKDDVYLRFAHDVGPLTPIGTSTVGAGTTGQIMLSGSWLDPGALQVTVEPPAGVTIDQVAVASPNDQVTLTVTVDSGAAVGAREIQVADLGGTWSPKAGSADRCPGCLVIGAAPVGALEIEG